MYQLLVGKTKNQPLKLTHYLVCDTVRQLGKYKKAPIKLEVFSFEKDKNNE